MLGGAAVPIAHVGGMAFHPLCTSLVLLVPLLSSFLWVVLLSGAVFPLGGAAVPLLRLGSNLWWVALLYRSLWWCGATCLPVFFFLVVLFSHFLRRRCCFPPSCSHFSSSFFIVVIFHIFMVCLLQFFDMFVYFHFSFVSTCSSFPLGLGVHVRHFARGGEEDGHQEDSGGEEKGGGEEREVGGTSLLRKLSEKKALLRRRPEGPSPTHNAGAEGLVEIRAASPADAQKICTQKAEGRVEGLAGSLSPSNRNWS